MSSFKFILLIVFTIMGSLSFAGGIMSPLPSKGGELSIKIMESLQVSILGKKASDAEVIDLKNGKFSRSLWKHTN